MIVWATMRHMPKPPTLKQRRLARELRRLRDDSELSNERAADLSGLSTAAISRAENALSRIASDDVRKLCQVYGADHETTERLATLARTARERGWWVKGYRVDDEFAAFLELETEARALYAWTIDIPPGLLQTEAYARALVRARNPHLPASEIDDVVKLRMRRQERRLDDLQLWAVVDESALLRPVGGPAVMSEQLAYLADVAEQPNVTLLVLPLTCGAGPAMSTPFHLFELDEHTGPPVAHVDYYTGSLYLEDPHEVGQYEQGFRHLTASALSPADSVARLLRASREMAG